MPFCLPTQHLYFSFSPAGAAHSRACILTLPLQRIPLGTARRDAACCHVEHDALRLLRDAIFVVVIFPALERCVYPASPAKTAHALFAPACGITRASSVRPAAWRAPGSWRQRHDEQQARRYRARGMRTALSTCLLPPLQRRQALSSAVIQAR